MAFAIRNLSVLAYANGFTLWHYKTRQDTAAAVCSAHYFDDAADMLTTGDVIIAACQDGAVQVVVRLSDVGHVVLAPFLPFPTTQGAA